MSYSTTPELQMQLAVPGSGQQFETTVVNDNFMKIDTRAAASKASPHAEYTYSVSAGNGASVGIGTATLQSAVSSSDAASFFTPVAGGFTLIKAGVYEVSFRMNLPVVTTGRTFLEFVANGSWRGSLGTGETDGSVSASFTAAAATNLQFGVFQTTGATQTVTGRVNITYLGPLG